VSERGRVPSLEDIPGIIQSKVAKIKVGMKMIQSFQFHGGQK
jgi:hypothetical protein